MFKWLVSRLMRTWEGFLSMATFWTSVFVMLVPIGLAVLVVRPSAKPVAFGIMAIGAVLGAIGLGLTIRDERVARDRENKEEHRRSQEDLRNQQEHDELISFLAGSKSKMTTPRVIRLIERIREVRNRENKQNDG